MFLLFSPSVSPTGWRNRITIHLQQAFSTYSIALSFLLVYFSQLTSFLPLCPAVGPYHSCVVKQKPELTCFTGKCGKWYLWNWLPLLDESWREQERTCEVKCVEKQNCCLSEINIQSLKVKMVSCNFSRTVHIWQGAQWHAAGYLDRTCNLAQK